MRFHTASAICGHSISGSERVLWRLSVIAAFMIAMVAPAYAGRDDGRPFGPMDDGEVQVFTSYAATHGVDLEAEMMKAYSGNPEGLARVFGLASDFRTFDANVKVFGNILYSTLLNMGEQRGVDIIVDAIDLIPQSERQRIRDFLFFPVMSSPKAYRAEAERDARESFPKLFPPDYQFSQGDALLLK